jgi:hypothetical protein
MDNAALLMMVLSRNARRLLFSSSSSSSFFRFIISRERLDDTATMERTLEEGEEKPPT